MSGPALVLQHIDCETLGILESVLGERGIPFRCVRPYAGEPLPKNTDGFSALIVMGGPMGVYEADKYPFLKDEMRLIEKTVRAGLPVLGICLGSQLLAAALGSNVRKGAQKEIGWYPVRFTEEAKKDPLFSGIRDGMAFHWHGDVFDLPRGAVALASSALTPLQAYRYGDNAYGCLFHMEVTAEMVREWVERFSGELICAKIDPRPIAFGADSQLPGVTAAGKRIFGRWADKIPQKGKSHARVR